MTAGAVAVPTIVPLRAPTPGQHKTLIDSNTRIELRTETPGASIFYTTNGLNPEPFQKHGPAAKATMKYLQPFRLTGGRRTVKAIAVADDGVRESHMVSKTFEVEQLASDEQFHEDDGTRFIDDIPHADRAKRDVAKMNMVTSKQAWAELQEMRRKDEMMQQLTLTDGAKHNRGTRFSNSRLGTERSGYGGLSKGRSENGLYTLNGQTGALVDADHRARKMPDTATQAMRLQRETDFLKCVYCFASRPADPYARFCNDCGNPVQPLPQTRIAPPEAGQMGTCVHCNSQVPFNTDKCLICEADIPAQNTPMASVKLGGKTICTLCGTGNPVNLETCVTCEAKLPLSAFTALNQTKALLSDGAPSQRDGRMQSCTKCGRVNSSDARFCDWCGTKPSPVTSTLVCTKCRASNNAYARFCASCGDLLEAPQRPEVTAAGLRMTNTGEKNGSAQWMPVGVINPVPKYDVSTQTIGLHYPSEKSISQTLERQEEQRSLANSMSDKKPVLTAVSPGKGYWRKQIDHINAHIKAQAQNNAEFRALIAEPRMGKILSTAVHEDGYELSLTVNFALRGTKDPFAGEKMGYSKRDFLSSYTKRGSLASYGSQDSLAKGQDDVSGRSTARSRKKSARKVKKKANTGTKLQEEHRMLLKEVGKNGEGRASEIEHWVEQGADANCKNKDELPVLFVACQNKHLEAIPVLVQEGADINAKGPNKGNTAVHDMVAAGHQYKEVIETLLKCGAKTTVKNDKGQTPYELALELGYESIANMFSAKLGQNTLKHMTKPPKRPAHDDTF